MNENELSVREVSSGVSSSNQSERPHSSRKSQRRMIERLSGWRLIAFFSSTALNLGLLIGLTTLPLFLSPAKCFLATAFVLASHSVFLIAVAGFRFPISAKFALGFSHATACAWALASIDALPRVKLGNLDVTTLYLLPMLTVMVTIGGIVVARLTGFHRSRRFAVIDILILVTAFAVLFPLVLQIVPQDFFVGGISPEDLKSAFAVAAVSGATCLLVSNLYLKFIPSGGHGLSPQMMVIGWFLLTAIVDWSLCQFGVLVGSWALVSLVPVYGITFANDNPRQLAE